ncbi:MAG TPA: alcohol dehydrogenase catalytic domain-containing protein [Candidatus Polarisedimenticolia bacterium]|nr:alcohol dehydrogenase catalytic domain-containing protein [Candidatus Polarisedimenticolia bacterium]
MKAVVIRTPHRAFFRDESKPRPGEGQVLVKVAAAGVCMSDVEVWKGTRPQAYVKYPVIPGHEWCGTVEEAGPGVKGLGPGQRVAVEGHNFCRACAWCKRGETNLCASYNEYGFTLPGGFAEYAVVRSDLAHAFSDTLPFESAALTEPFACVVHGCRRANVKPGDTVVVVGPGTIGLLAAGWAKRGQPRHVIVVGVDRVSEAVARQMGATEYLTVSDDPVSRVRALTGGAGADVVLEAAGSESALPLSLEMARRGGTVVLMGITGGGRRLFMEADVFALKDLRVDGVFAYTTDDFTEALRLIETGRLEVKPLVTHRFALRDFEKAFDLLSTRKEPVVKVMLNP